MADCRNQPGALTLIINENAQLRKPNCAFRKK